MPGSLITDEIKALIGIESEPERNRFPISAEMAYDVADAIEDYNPLYVDADYAERSRFGGLLCPPLAAWKDIAPPIGYFGAGQEWHFEVPLPFNSYGLNGGSDWQFLAPARVGSWVTRQFRVLDIFEKQGRSGPLVFIVREETQTDQHGAELSRARRVSIHRALPAGEQPTDVAQVAEDLTTVAVAPPNPEVILPKPAPTAQGQRHFEDVAVGDSLPPVVKGPMTTTHLIRWAAANGNYARIHWDLPFAQLRQGLPNVVVNGSLKKSVPGTTAAGLCRRRGVVQAVLRGTPGHGLSRRHAHGVRPNYRQARSGRLRVRGLRRRSAKRPGQSDGIGHGIRRAAQAWPVNAVGVGGGSVVAPGIPQLLPLNGVRVLELGGHVSAPFCARLLADYGADVIKIETPGVGDAARRMGPFAGDDPHPDKSIPFLYLNTNKRGITLDPTAAAGAALLAELLESADVLVENYAPGEKPAPELETERLARQYPNLIVTSITPFGQTGPYRNFAATDIVTTAFSGLMYHSGDSDREPLRNALNQSFYVAGINGAVATTAALFRRMATGMGRLSTCQP